MSGTLATRDPIEADYETIQDAVMETERGRWFLSEYARRNRQADTEMLLLAIGRIEKTVSLHQESSEVDKFRLNVLEMSRAIARTRQEIAAMQQPDSKASIVDASGELDSIVLATEKATSEILAAGEKVQEVAWTLREAGADTAACDSLDHHAVAIYTACSFQDLTAQRTRKVIDALAFLENRVNAMADIWQFADERGAEPVPAPPPPVAVDMSQADVDTVLVEEEIADADFEIEMSMKGIGTPGSSHAAAGLPDDVIAIDPVPAVVSAAPVSDPAPSTEAPAVDSILFDEPRPEPLPEVLPPLKLVREDAVAKDFFARVKSGGTLSATEAGAAMDALKNMSIEERTKLFS